MLYLIGTVCNDTLHHILKEVTKPILAPWAAAVHLSSFTFHARSLKSAMLTCKTLCELVDDRVWSALLENLPRDKAAWNLSNKDHDFIAATIFKICRARHCSPSWSATAPSWSAPWLVCVHQHELSWKEVNHDALSPLPTLSSLALPTCSPVGLSPAMVQGMAFDDQRIAFKSASKDSIICTEVRSPNRKIQPSSLHSSKRPRMLLLLPYLVGQENLPPALAPPRGAALPGQAVEGNAAQALQPRPRA